MPDLRDASLEEIAAELERQTGLAFHIMFWKEEGEC